MRSRSALSHAAMKAMAGTRRVIPRIRSRPARAIVVVALLLGLPAWTLLWSERNDGPSNPARIRTLRADRALSTPSPQAYLTKQGPVLCEDSTPPYYAWHFAYVGPFNSVARFYSDSLAGDHWTYRGTTSDGTIAFGKRFRGWTANGIVCSEAGGYVIRVDLQSDPGCG